MMRITSLNLRRGLYKNYETVIKWIRNNKIDILFNQDPFSEFRSSFNYDIYCRPVGGNNKLYIWQSNNLYQIGLVKQDEFCQHAIVNDILIINLYLDSSSKKSIRANQLHRINYQIKSYLSNNKYPIIILGDFNLAPRPEDGLYDNEPSTWNSPMDRKPFFNLLSAHSLIDIGEKVPGFTYEKNNRGKLIQFRCDLCLVSESISDRIQLKYDHTVRKGQSAFTDHSALIIDILESDKHEPDFEDNSSFIQTKYVKNDNQLNNSQQYCFDPSKTAIRRKGPTLYAKDMVEKYRKIQRFQSVLDFGCGWSVDAEYYEKHGLQARGYDCDNRFGHSEKPDRKFDLVTMIFVLNVLPTKELRLKALSEAKEYLEKNGCLLVVTRSPGNIRSNAHHWEKWGGGYLSRKFNKQIDALGRIKATFQKGISKEEIVALAKKVGLSLHPKDSCIKFKQNSCYALFINDR